MMIKTETWNNFEIRFVQHNGEWWAVAKDVAVALDYKDTINAIKRHCKGVAKHHLGVETGLKATGEKATQIVEVNIIPESDIYRMAFRSHKAEAESFQDWVCDILKQLRKAEGLEGFEVFRMLDKEHQNSAMGRLKTGLHNTSKRDYIKANTIANKAISNLYGFPKILNKEEMSPDMLPKRQEILDDTVNLMTANESFDLGLSVSKVVYNKYNS